MEAMLAENSERHPNIDTSDWLLSQKVDGHRLIVETTDNKVRLFNRNGQPYVYRDPKLGAAFELPGRWVFDGELVEDEYFLFDLPLSPLHGPDTPIEDRLKHLTTAYKQLFKNNPSIHLVPVFPNDESLMCQFDTKGFEGVILKRPGSPYRPGQRHPDWLKVKFTKRADCIVTEVRPEGKHSVALGMIHDDNPEGWSDPVAFQGKWLVSVGSCLASDRLLQRVKLGDVVEIDYLYAGSGNRLYQPRFQRIRHDKSPLACTTDQLTYTNGTVLRSDENKGA